MIPSFRLVLVLGALALALAAVGCGESDDDGGASDPAGSQSEQDNAQDTARTKLEQCLRDNGAELPDQGGQGGGFGQLSEAERQKFQDAIEGPCADLRDDAIGDTSPEQQQEFQDAAVKFRECMRDQGIDVGSGTPGAGGGGGGGLSQLDSSDPEVQEALEKCQDLMPELGGLGGGG
jgi:hypothetical protein